VGYEASAEVEEHDPTLATPVESAYTTPSSEPRRRQEDEESDPFDVDLDEGSDPFIFRDDERPRQRSFSEDEAEADPYFKQYFTTSFHPDDKAADNKIRVIYSLVTQSPESITVQAVPNLTAQERHSTTKVRYHRRTRYKTRFWPLYAMSYHKAKRASQFETVFRLSLTRDDTMKLGFHDLNTYTYERRIWPTQLLISAVGTARFVPSDLSVIVR
jgi:hypothetical protein